MTSQEKLAAVRQAVIAAVPSIMDLTFGCDTNLGYVVAEDKNGIWLVNLDYLIGGLQLYSKTQMQFSNNFKIIGRKITIADVLLAMEKQIGHAHWWAKKKIELVGQWDCKTDDLSRATPETVDFLYDVLCV